MAACWVKPDFVRSRGLTMELEAECLKAFNDLAVFESRQPTHTQALTING